MIDDKIADRRQNCIGILWKMWYSSVYNCEPSSLSANGAVHCHYNYEFSGCIDFQKHKQIDLNWPSHLSSSYLFRCPTCHLKPMCDLENYAKCGPCGWVQVIIEGHAFTRYRSAHEHTKVTHSVTCPWVSSPMFQHESVVGAKTEKVRWGGSGALLIPLANRDTN